MIWLVFVMFVLCCDVLCRAVPCRGVQPCIDTRLQKVSKIEIQLETNRDAWPL